jgi:hypothetical protein
LRARDGDGRSGATNSEQDDIALPMMIDSPDQCHPLAGGHGRRRVRGGSMASANLLAT